MIRKILVNGLPLVALLILLFCFLPKSVNAATCEAYRVIAGGPCVVRVELRNQCPGGFETVINQDDCACQCIDSDDGGGGGVSGGGGATEVETAIGPISYDPNEFVPQLIKILISISGGIALVLMVFGSLQVILSSGNPDKVKGGQEIITSAVMGLIFIIFSIFLLQFIGVELFAIPGFGNG